MHNPNINIQICGGHEIAASHLLVTLCLPNVRKRVRRSYIIILVAGSGPQPACLSLGLQVFPEKSRVFLGFEVA